MTRKLYGFRNRSIGPEDGWRVPLVAPDGVAIVTPSCRDRTRYAITARAGIGLRIGGEARLCFECGPSGGVYHPASYSMAEGATCDATYTLADVLRIAGELPFATGYDPADLTPSLMQAYDAELRRRMTGAVADPSTDNTGQ